MSTPPSPATPGRPLQQARSRNTMNRILDATERLLELQPFDRISIQDITREAGVATGSFYTGFTRKADVLVALFERYLCDTEELAEQAAARLEGAQRSLAGRVEAMCELMVRTFRARRGVSRSAQLHYLQHPEQADDGMRRRLAAMYETIAGVIAGDGSDIPHDDPAAASRFAVQLGVALSRSKILFTDHPVPDLTPGDDDSLVKELTTALVGYLLMEGNKR